MEEILELCEMIVDRYEDAEPLFKFENSREDKEEIMIYLSALAYIERHG